MNSTTRREWILLQDENEFYYKTGMNSTTRREWILLQDGNEFYYKTGMNSTTRREWIPLQDGNEFRNSGKVSSSYYTSVNVTWKWKNCLHVYFLFSGRCPSALSIDVLNGQGYTTDNLFPTNHGHAVSVPGAAAAWVDTVETFGSGKVYMICLYLFSPFFFY